MSKTMLIDAANAEEIRVCLLQNGKVEDFDFESASRKPLRGNIYLARVTRVEPSLQAAFVEFGGNRHGFLAFNEIHPDYYQIPVSDRKILQEAEAEEAAIAAALNAADGADDDDRDLDEIAGDIPEERHSDGQGKEASRSAEVAPSEHDDDANAHEASDGDLADQEHGDSEHAHEAAFDAAPLEFVSADSDGGMSADDEHQHSDNEFAASVVEAEEIETDSIDSDVDSETDEEGSEEDGAEEADQARERTPLEIELAALSRPQLIERYREARRKRARLLRNYKIQEVVKRRQILLVQAVKEERGNKGAALTTYLSLAGRYCVLMPNTARGGGISRKIPVAADRKRLRRVVESLDVPNGMGLIIRTAGAKRTKAEIKRDYEYLVRLWENIRNLTLKSIAPCLIYEEASLIKRAIRDLYDKDINTVLVEGDNGYREAKDFMKMLMPSHAKNVQAFKETTPLFLKYGVETQLDAMYRPTVRLKSGGYIVINQTEALIAIDVNSGKSTRERNIEQTALRTNLEAADEVARQCRLRDLAGLIVIDFIDMEEPRNNRSVENRLKDALRADRARIQLGRISGFGLLELSRQRRRSGIVDGTTHMCPTCGGAGAVRSHEMAALRILRAAEHESLTTKAAALQIKAATDVTLYILNNKREWLARIERDYGVRIEFIADPAKAGDNFEIEKSGARAEQAPAPVIVRADMTETIEAEDEPEAASDEIDAANDDASVERSDDERQGRRKRRRRRRRRDENMDAAQNDSSGDEKNDHGGADSSESRAPNDSGDEVESDRPERERSHEANSGDGEDRNKRRRRRGRRGGRRSRREEGGDQIEAVSADGAQPEYFEPTDAVTAADENDAVSDEVEIRRETYVERVETIAATPSDPATAQPASQPEPAATTGGKPQVAPEAEPSFAESSKPTRRGWWNKVLNG